ncbi:hypothetical protein KIN20_026156 [Parelaphostrongylus tenuis]|uniref:Uncharacterized protein n=1 Tax=Parelaphostrongylus tenuis TaxID=148309 RepID=A0AAD5MWB5_PARTN|nr:hypothetical protein KIN20_026156 [Parelaphostrongylus tenuis]
MSSKLFTAALQWMMKSLDWDEKGIHIDEVFLSNLSLADLVVIFSARTSEGETMVKQFNQTRKIGLRLDRMKRKPKGAILNKSNEVGASPITEIHLVCTP